MADLALRIHPKSVVKGKYIYYEPKGSVVRAYSDRMVKWFWCKLICELPRPDHPRPQDLVKLDVELDGWPAVKSLWSASLMAEYERTVDQYGLDAVNDFWNDRIVPLGVIGPLFKTGTMVPRGTYSMWGDKDLMDMAIVEPDGGTDIDIETWDAMTVRYRLGDIAQTEPIYTRARVVPDFEGRLSLTPEQRAALADRSVKIMPFRDIKMRRREDMTSPDASKAPTRSESDPLPEPKPVEIP